MIRFASKVPFTGIYRNVEEYPAHPEPERGPGAAGSSGAPLFQDEGVQQNPGGLVLLRCHAWG